jgi:hypothetical protein
LKADCVCSVPAYLKGRFSTVGLLFISRFYELLLISQILFTFFTKTSFLNEVSSTELSFSLQLVSVLWIQV